MEKAEKKKNSFIEFLKWIETFVIAIFIALVIRGFIMEPVIVHGISMEDTLVNGQRLIIYKLGYFLHPPERGDIIVLQYQKGSMINIPFLNKFAFWDKVLPSPSEVDYIKRVIGIPGDKLDVKEDGYIYINDVKQEEPYIKGKTYKQIMDFPTKVPPNTVFVMGDNRQNSRDSRMIGFIEFDRIKGKAVLRIWPFKDWGFINR
ncbi:MAG TPA: signal peptidase I [Clostridiales bacterium]|nr:signal peptidase I [Clostridiales bacterium]